MADIPFINRAQVDQTTGIIVATTDAPDDTFAFLGAIAFASDMSMAVTTDTPPAAIDTLNEGISITPAGQVHVWNFDDNGTPPSGIFYVGIGEPRCGPLLESGKMSGADYAWTVRSWMHPMGID